MAIYYFCSGFGMEHSFVNKFGELLAKDLKKTNSLVMIPCEEEPDTIDAQRAFFTNQLEEVGITFENCVVLSSSMAYEEQCEQIKNADLIYLMGGYPFSQKNFIVNNQLRQSLQKYSGILLGISAGAMNMSSYIIMVTDGVNSDEIRVEEGLGLVDFSVFPHCAFSGDIFAKSFYIGSDLVDSAKLLSAGKDLGEVYCLQNKTETDQLKISFIRVENGRKEFVSMFEGRIWRISENGFELIKEYI